VIYQHPLAYLLGLQGMALMWAFNGDYVREFTHARIAEIRALLDDPDARLECTGCRGGKCGPAGCTSTRYGPPRHPRFLYGV
jgi:hypothetical protein